MARKGFQIPPLERLRRRQAASVAAQKRLRCSGCGSFLTIQGECRHPDCEGHKAPRNLFR